MRSRGSRCADARENRKATGTAIKKSDFFARAAHPNRNTFSARDVQPCERTSSPMFNSSCVALRINCPRNRDGRDPWRLPLESSALYCAARKRPTMPEGALRARRATRPVQRIILRPLLSGQIAALRALSSSRAFPSPMRQDGIHFKTGVAGALSPECDFSRIKSGIFLQRSDIASR